MPNTPETTPAKPRRTQVLNKDARGKFGPGNVANPNGRPKGSVSGRKKFMQMFDNIVGDEATLTRLKLALAGHIAGEPLDFIRNYLYPLLPKETVLAIEDSVEKAGVRLRGLEDEDNESTVPSTSTALPDTNGEGGER